MKSPSIRSSGKRLLVVLAGYLALFEVLCQLSVSWRESTEEVCHFALVVSLPFSLIWVVRPAIRKHGSTLSRAVPGTLAVLLLFVGIHTVIYYFSWHVRPNVGLYQEPEWVAEHPEFQKQLRARIERNKW